MIHKCICQPKCKQFLYLLVNDTKATGEYGEIELLKHWIRSELLNPIPIEFVSTSSNPLSKTKPSKETFPNISTNDEGGPAWTKRLGILLDPF